MIAITTSNSISVNPAARMLIPDDPLRHLGLLVVIIPIGFDSAPNLHMPSSIRIDWQARVFRPKKAQSELAHGDIAKGNRLVLSCGVLTRSLVQIFGVTMALAGALFWLATGANRGWTKTRVAIKSVDEVTGIEGIRYRKQFVPGVDFLAVALIGGSVVEAGALLIRRQKK